MAVRSRLQLRLPPVSISPDDTFASRLFTTDELIYMVRTHYAETDDDSDYTELLIFDWSGSFKYRMKIENIFILKALREGDTLVLNASRNWFGPDC